MKCDASAIGLQTLFGLDRKTVRPICRNRLLRQVYPYLFGTSTGYGYFIKLSHGRTGKEGAFGWVLNGGREEDVFTIGGKCGWDFSGRVGGQALGCSTVGWHYEYVEVTVSVTGKCYLLAVR